MTIFSRELKTYCSIKKINNVESKQNKINGKSIRGWMGIKNGGNDDSHNDHEITIL